MPRTSRSTRRRAAARPLPLLLGLALAAASCAEEPTELNSPTVALPLAGAAVRETTLVASASASFRQSTPMDADLYGGNISLLGRTGGTTASLALEFYPSLFTFRDTIIVYDATLTLRAATWYGDSSGTLAFDVHRIERAWNPSLLTWDSLGSGFYDPAVVRGSYTGGAAPDTHAVTLHLDTTMVREWLRTPTSGMTTKYGIVLIPRASSSIVRGFVEFLADSEAQLPTLRVIAGNTAGTTRDTGIYNAGVITFAANLEGFAPDPALLYLQAGIVYRSSVTFDVSALPRGAIVNSAELQLDLDPPASRLTRFVRDTAAAAQALLSASDNTQFAPQYATSLGRRRSGTTANFGFDVRPDVQSWIQGSNYGLLLRVPTASEYSTLDLYAFYGHTAATAAQRPRLRVVYSVRSQ